MGLVNTVSKVVMFMGLMSAPVMLAVGLGLMDAPAMLANANGGAGPSKFEWASSVSGFPVRTIFTVVAIAKFAAIADIYFLHVMPRLACICVAVMMGVIYWGHTQVEDDLAPPIVLGAAALVAAASWPEDGAKTKRN